MKMFSIGEYVYLKHDADQCRRMVTQILETAAGFQYVLSFGSSEVWAYDIEISRDIDVLAKIEMNQKDEEA